MKNQVFKGCRKMPLTLNVLVEKLLQICYFFDKKSSYSQWQNIQHNKTEITQ